MSVANARRTVRSNQEISNTFLNKFFFFLGMVKALEVDPGKLIEKVSSELKKEAEITPPSWALFVKTGRHKERPPADANWWHVRSAAMLRSVAKLGPIGVSKLTVKYGGKPNRGHKPGRFYRGSGSIARKVLRQLEKAGLVRSAQKGTYKGRVITRKAAEILNKAASESGATESKKRTKAKKKAGE